MQVEMPAAREIQSMNLILLNCSSLFECFRHVIKGFAHRDKRPDVMVIAHTWNGTLPQESLMSVLWNLDTNRLVDPYRCRDPLPYPFYYCVWHTFRSLIVFKSDSNSVDFNRGISSMPRCVEIFIANFVLECGCSSHFDDLEGPDKISFPSPNPQGK